MGNKGVTESEVVRGNDQVKEAYSTLAKVLAKACGKGDDDEHCTGSVTQISNYAFQLMLAGDSGTVQVTARLTESTDLCAAYFVIWCEEDTSKSYRMPSRQMSEYEVAHFATTLVHFASKFAHKTD